jgi:uncharacterized membrane protein YesL
MISARARENLRRASECMLLGVLWLAFSLPLVTSGAAWLAVARVCTAWSRDVEPPLLRTFFQTVRDRLPTGLALQAVAAGAAFLPYLELRIALAAEVPGARLEAALLAVLAAGALSVALLSVPAAAADGLTATAALRESLALVRRVPLAAVAALAALAAGSAVVYLLPVLALVMAGPVGFAVTAAWVWAGSRTGARVRSSRPGPGRAG